MSVINNRRDHDNDVIMHLLPPLPNRDIRDFEGDVIMQGSVSFIHTNPPSLAPTFTNETPVSARRVQTAYMDSLRTIYIQSVLQQAQTRPTAPSAPPVEEAVNIDTNQNMFTYVELSQLPSSFQVPRDRETLRQSSRGNAEMPPPAPRRPTPSQPPLRPSNPSSLAPIFSSEAGRVQTTSSQSLSIISTRSFLQHVQSLPAAGPSAPSLEEETPSGTFSQTLLPFEPAFLPSSFHLTQEEENLRRASNTHREMPHPAPRRATPSQPPLRPSNPPEIKRDERDLFPFLGEGPTESVSPAPTAQPERRIGPQSFSSLSLNRSHAVTSSQTETSNQRSSMKALFQSPKKTRQKRVANGTDPGIFTNSLSLAPSNAVSRPNAIRPPLNDDTNLHTAPSVRAARQAKFPAIVRLPSFPQEPLLSIRDDERMDTNTAPLKRSKRGT